MLYICSQGPHRSFMQGVRCSTTRERSVYCNRVRDTKACLQAGNAAAKALKMKVYNLLQGLVVSE
jgi:hypothetical protein